MPTGRFEVHVGDGEWDHLGNLTLAEYQEIEHRYEKATGKFVSYYGLLTYPFASVTHTRECIGAVWRHHGFAQEEIDAAFEKMPGSVLLSDRVCRWNANADGIFDDSTIPAEWEDGVPLSIRRAVGHKEPAPSTTSSSSSPADPGAGRPKSRAPKGSVTSV